MLEGANKIPEEIQLQIADDEGMFDRRQSLEEVILEQKYMVRDEVYELQIKNAEWEGMRSTD